MYRATSSKRRGDDVQSVNLRSASPACEYDDDDYLDGQYDLDAQAYAGDAWM